MSPDLAPPNTDRRWQAWLRGLTGAPLETVSAAFVHVRSGTTVRPVDLLDLDGLRALVTGVELAPG